MLQWQHRACDAAGETLAVLLKRQQEHRNVLRDALVSSQVPRLVCHRHVLASRAERTEQTVKYR